VGGDEAPEAENPSPVGTADNSPEPAEGAYALGNEKKENNSTLPKAVAGERSSQATVVTTVQGTPMLGVTEPTIVAK